MTVVPFPATQVDLDVDDWGRDVRTVRRAASVASLRWAPILGGLHEVDPHGPAMLVCNTRHLALNPLLVAWSVGRALDRPVRFAGLPDVAPVGPLLRRIGGLLADPDELDTAVAGGDVVVVGSEATRDTRRAGRVPTHLLEGAWLRQVPVHPVAVLGSPLDRRVRVEIGRPVATRRTRRGPLGPTELAEATRSALQKLLDETAGPSLLV